jgi:hypothetical protein
MAAVTDENSALDCGIVSQIFMVAVFAGQTDSLSPYALDSTAATINLVVKRISYLRSSMPLI